jgi:hydroxymethylpyrimidine pyrophosphatase-like HAD family hydrolase
MAKKRWSEDPIWFENYARRVMELKRPDVLTESVPTYIVKSIRSTFRRVYRAVAFDIDGTLTDGDSSHVRKEMSSVVGDLLERGVPVILVTGRGRTSARQAASEIRLHSGLSDWYMRRLQCITHNGVFLLQTPVENPSAFLELEETIQSTPFDVDLIHRKLEEEIENESLRAAIMAITKEPKSIRLMLAVSQDLNAVERCIRRLIKGMANENRPLYLSRGSYEGNTCLDVSATNKMIGLIRAAASIGVEPARIARIGDQGNEGGNDFDLLNCDSGFSVKEFSQKPTVCLPVLSEDLTKSLKGARATRRLLDLLLLFPSLSISPDPLEVRVRNHRKFEHLALVRSRQETDTVTQRLRVRLRYLLPDVKGFVDPHTVKIGDIYDMRSGAVILREWELDDLPQDHIGLRLFDIQLAPITSKAPPENSWSMYSDTGILLRGPNYYFSLAAIEKTISNYVSITSRFVKNAKEVIEKLLSEDVDLTRYKIALAVFDNVRNILLQMIYIAFVIEGQRRVTSFEFTKHLFKHFLMPHTRLHFDFLLNPDTDWSSLLRKYELLLRELPAFLHKTVAALGRKYNQFSGIDLKRVGDLFKWRECDNFLQNVTAVQLGLHELYQRPNIRSAKRLSVIGLAYGGTELPAIASVVAETRGLSLDAALAKVSIYGNREASEKIRRGEHQYVTDLLDKTKPVCLLSGKSTSLEDSSFILMDDNMTTGVTLQLARDFLVMQGADVLGSIIIRFPGVNRHTHMSMTGHGFPDPEVLFSFVRGLIAPSPYTRLLFRNKGKDPYLDQAGIFDKAKERIQRYLLKNGTPVVKVQTS